MRGAELASNFADGDLRRVGSGIGDLETGIDGGGDGLAVQARASQSGFPPDSPILIHLLLKPLDSQQENSCSKITTFTGFYGFFGVDWD
jgi:hypothetical protein